MSSLRARLSRNKSRENVLVQQQQPVTLVAAPAPSVLSLQKPASLPLIPIGYSAGAPLPLVPVQQTQFQQAEFQQAQFQQAQFQQAQFQQAQFQQTQFVQQTQVLQTTGLTNQFASTSLNAGVTKQTIVRPAIIQETVRTDTLVQVQPILHREIDQQRIHHVEQHITERAAPATGGTIKLAPIVQETVRTNVIEEVQPIIHREIATRQVERVEEHMTERVAAPAIHTTGAALLAGQATSTISKPAIIDERVRTDRLIEVVPVIHREIEQARIHHVEQHITERAAPAMGGTVRLAPIVQETVRTNVVEEVQPVIHRERAVQQVQRVEEHLQERVAAPVIHTTGTSLGERGVHSTIAKPAIIDERIRTDRLVEVQPIVHREIEQARIHHIEQHITERAAPAMGGTVKLAPIVQETVHTNVVEEVQPVIHRERAVRQVERVEEHVQERVAAPAIHTTGLPLGQREVHTTVAKPAIIDQRIRTDRLIEVQPVVHREIQQPRIHHVEKHITEAPAPNMSGVVKMAPVIQQTVRTNVIEEVQPVIHREIATRSVERVEEHLTERIAAPAIHTHEVQTTATITTLPLQQGPLIQTLPLTQPALPLVAAPLSQGLTSTLPLNNQAAINNNLAALDKNLATVDRNLALQEKAAVHQSTATPAFAAAGGPANIARPL